MEGVTWLELMKVAGLAGLVSGLIVKAIDYALQGRVRTLERRKQRVEAIVSLYTETMAFLLGGPWTLLESGDPAVRDSTLQRFRNQGYTLAGRIMAEVGTGWATAAVLNCISEAERLKTPGEAAAYFDRQREALRRLEAEILYLRSCVGHPPALVEFPRLMGPLDFNDLIDSQFKAASMKNRSQALKAAKEHLASSQTAKSDESAGDVDI